MEALLPALSFFEVQDSECITLSLYDRYPIATVEDPSSVLVGNPFDLNRHLLPSPGSTYLVRLNDDSMVDLNMPKGALLLVDRSLKPINNSVVVAMIDHVSMVRTYIVNSSGIRLMPANPKFQPIPVGAEQHFFVWGVVTKVIIDTFRP